MRALSGKVESGFPSESASEKNPEPPLVNVRLGALRGLKIRHRAEAGKRQEQSSLAELAKPRIQSSCVQFLSIEARKKMQ
jgi:hypothetical protein